jgi:pimeloyl-ACP methyl ester carboxylesterase
MQQPASQTALTSSAPARPRPDRRWLVLDLIGVLLLLLGYGVAFGQVGAYEAGVTRQTFTVSGAIPVPVIYLRPASRRGDAIAVIVHGYAGSKEVMIGFGLELARMGVPSYLLDLPGHSESPVPLATLPSGGPAPQLEQALDEVVAYARVHSDVPQPKIILLGHSLGTRVVGDYALHQPSTAIAATILVSPILQEQPTLTQPANLLVLVGAHDIPGIITRAPAIIGAGCGVALSLDTQRFDCGASGQHTARRLMVVPGVNHITILTDATTFRAMDAWVGVTDALPTVPVESDTRLHWTELGVASAFLALFPLIGLFARLLMQRGAPPPQRTAQVSPAARAARPPRWAGLGIFALGVVLTALLLRGWSAAADAFQLPLLRTPLSWVGVTLADYSASYSLVLALTVGGLLYALRRRLPLPVFASSWRQVALAAIVFLVLYATVGTLATYAWQRFLLDAPRLVRGIPLALAGVPLFLLIEGLFAADQQGPPWRSALARLGAYLLLCAGIVGAIELDPALGFLSLLVPIEVLLLCAVATLAWQIDRQRRQLSVSSAILAALILGWAIAAVFPIVS